MLVIHCLKGWEPLRKLDSGGIFYILESKAKVLSLLILVCLYFMPVSHLIRAPFELSAFKSCMSEIFMIVIVLILVSEFGQSLNGSRSL